MYLCNFIRVLARVEGQAQRVDMRAFEVSIGNAVVELQRRSSGRLFGKELVVSERWHEAKGGKQRSESDDGLFVDIGKRVVEF